MKEIKNILFPIDFSIVNKPHRKIVKLRADALSGRKML